MPGGLSPRAQEILAAIEREAEGRREALPGPGGAARSHPQQPPPGAVTIPRAAAAAAPPADPSRLLALVDEIVRQTDDARDRLASINAQIGEVERRLDQAVPATGDAPQVVAPPPPAAPRAPAVRRPAPAAPLPDGTAGIPDSARLVAIEMAVGGSTRREVGRRLSAEYGIADSAPILDDVFGPGSDDDSRMPWGR